MAVLSNKPDEFTRLCVDKLLPGWQFAAVLGAGPSLPRKPDPAGARQIAGRLGVVPDEVVYLGIPIPTCRRPSPQGCSPSARFGVSARPMNWTPAAPKWLVERPPDLLGILGQ